MKNWVIIGIVAILILIPIKAKSSQGDPTNSMEEEFLRISQDQIDGLDISTWDDFIKEIENSQDTLIKDFDVKTTIKNLVSGNFKFDWMTLFQTIGNFFFREIGANISFMAKIFAIAIMSGMLNNFKANFSSSSVGELAWIICYVMIVILIVQSMTSILQLASRTMDLMTSFMQILFPTLLALLIGMGGIASSGIIQPATILLAGISGVFLKNIMIPLIFLSTILVLVGNINQNIKLDKLAKLTKNLCTWTLGILSTVFIGVLSLQGILAASFDGISIRTTKYAIETFVPVVGKMFSETVDVIIGCSLLLKNAVGVAGLLIAAMICIYPIIKIISLMAIYKLGSALLEPISDERIVDCLNDIGSILVILFITVAGVTLMFFMTIALLVGVGNITIMMR